MKVAFVVLALVSLGWAAPQPRKSFHEHFRDFVDIINRESSHEMEHLIEHYMEFDEFISTINYMTTKDFNKLVHEMQDLPEFKAVVEFLEEHDIDILYFIDMVNELLDMAVPIKTRQRHQLSGKDLSAFIVDTIEIFPKQLLAALYDEKMEDSEEFRRAMVSLQSDEWKQLWNALWESDEFKIEISILSENGIQVDLLLNEVFAIFGQN